MIVISGALVLVALVLLIVGVVGPDLAFVYASIGVSLVSLGFLVVGILQRRDEPATELEGVQAPQSVAVDDPGQGTTVRPSSVRRAPDPAVGPSANEADDADEVEAPVADAVDAPPAPAVEAPPAPGGDVPPAPGGDVLVVEGRPRYHVAGCRYLSGKTSEAVEVGRARDEGFTPCGVCKPDVALAALPALAQEESVPAPAPARTAPARGGSVVVIPERGRYHLATCRYVRDVGGAEVLSRSAATRQGYAPCGVCKP